MHAQPDWVLQNLLMNGLQGLMGDENYEAVFGHEPFTPIALRFTDALSPNWDAVWNSIMDHPMESLTAVWNNLPLLASDINLPITLALAQTALSVVMPQLLIPAINDALFDPNTSILAGLLNARDDFATAILTATDAWPTELGEQATQQWANMADLIASTPASTCRTCSGLISSRQATTQVRDDFFGQCLDRLAAVAYDPVGQPDLQGRDHQEATTAGRSRVISPASIAASAARVIMSMPVRQTSRCSPR